MRVRSNFLVRVTISTTCKICFKLNNYLSKNEEILLNFRFIDSTFLFAESISPIQKISLFLFKNNQSLQYQIDPHKRNFEIFKVFTHHSTEPPNEETEKFQILYTPHHNYHNVPTLGNLWNCQSLYTPQQTAYTPIHRGTLKFSKSLHTTAQSLHQYATEEVSNFFKIFYTHHSSHT